jgi:bifunctional non-homologous end joining protein LigD
MKGTAHSDGPREVDGAVGLCDKGKLKPCGSAGSGLSEAAVKQIRAALDAGKPVVVEVEHRGFTPDGELRHRVIRGWEIG